MLEKRHSRLATAIIVAWLVAGVAHAGPPPPDAAHLLPGNVVAVPTPLVLSAADPAGDLVCEYLGGGSAPVYGFSIDVEWDPLVATAGAFTLPDAGPFADAALFQVIDVAPGHVRVDAALGGLVPGIDAGELFKTTFTAVAGEGVDTIVDFTINDVRDSQNQPVDGLVEDDGSIVIDTGLPTVTDVVLVNDTLPHTDDFVKDTDQITLTATVTDGDPDFGAAGITADLTGLGGGADVTPDSYVATVATWTLAAVTCTPADGIVTVTVTATDDAGNTAAADDTITSDNTAPTPLTGVVALPGHDRIRLSWDDFAGNDANVYGVEFRQSGWLDYPQYDDTEPTYPADHTAGALAVQFAGGTDGQWTDIADRDIYYVAGFVYDVVLNYGASDPGGGHQARATSYWLGDVEPAPDGDGDVDIFDVTVLGACYGEDEGDPLFNPACDVGPTDTMQPDGVPLPDDSIEFDDLMVFSLNFGEVAPLLRDLGPAATPVLAWEQVDAVTWALRLGEPCAGLKGLNLAADLPAGVTCQVAAGELLGRQDAPCFLRNIPAHGLDAGLAILGRGVAIAGAGELCRVTFSQPVAALDVAVRARDVTNQDLLVDLSGTTGIDAPAAAFVGQNYPNPFNPSTTIALGLPQAGHVRLAVYGLDGTRVRVLLDEHREAGRHEVVWDGRDHTGRVVATGTYFYVVDAGDFHQVRKMVLMK